MNLSNLYYLKLWQKKKFSPIFLFDIIELAIMANYAIPTILSCSFIEIFHRIPNTQYLWLEYYKYFLTFITKANLHKIENVILEPLPINLWEHWTESVNNLICVQIISSKSESIWIYLKYFGIRNWRIVKLKYSGKHEVQFVNPWFRLKTRLYFKLRLNVVGSYIRKWWTISEQYDGCHSTIQLSLHILGPLDYQRTLESSIPDVCKQNARVHSTPCELVASCYYASEFLERLLSIERLMLNIMDISPEYIHSLMQINFKCTHWEYGLAKRISVKNQNCFYVYKYTLGRCIEIQPNLNSFLLLWDYESKMIPKKIKHTIELPIEVHDILTIIFKLELVSVHFKLYFIRRHVRMDIDYGNQVSNNWSKQIKYFRIYEKLLRRSINHKLLN